jgi:hypothetical protein
VTATVAAAVVVTVTAAVVVATVVVVVVVTPGRFGGGETITAGARQVAEGWARVWASVGGGEEATAAVVWRTAVPGGRTTGGAGANKSVAPREMTSVVAPTATIRLGAPRSTKAGRTAE